MLAMTLEQLDMLRGYSIAAVILAGLAIGACAFIPSAKIQRALRLAASFVGGLAGFVIFFLFSFIDGWDEYFATKAAGRATPEYRGPHQAAAVVIRTLGDMDVFVLGLVFGVIGLVFLAVTYVQIRALHKP
jgi:hypothetical protein